MTQSNRHISSRFRHLPVFSHSRTIFTASVTLALIGIPALALAAYTKFQDSPKAVLDQAWQIVDREYVDPKFNQVDWRQVRHSLLTPSYTSREAAYNALRDALKKLNDPYTRFMDPKEFQAFKSESDGELTGVGMELTLDKQTQALTVVKPIENSPALRAGVQAGDKILKIDGRTTQGMTVETAASLIRGEPNTQVQLVMQHQAGAPFDVTLTRTRVEIPAVESALHVEGQKRVGYIRLSEFTAHAADQMKDAITNLQKQNANEFVLDLRGNPGGRLDQGIAIARMWIDNGDIVRTVDRAGESEQITANHTALTNLPLAVLVDGNSASASEILTGALKDDHRAVVVGTQTFGKALVQSVNSLSDGSGLNVTIAHYFTPSGLDINHKGIAPDRIVSLTDAQKQDLASHPATIGTDHDPQYEQAINQLAQTASAAQP
jgi:carboxyl-terminal processing protease